MANIYSKSLKDIFSLDVILFVIKVTMLSLVVSISIVWYYFDEFSSFIVNYLSFIPWDWLKNSGAKIITILLSYMIFLICLSAFTSLMSEKLLIRLAKKNYPNSTLKGSSDTLTSLSITTKSSMLSLLFFILFIPFIFIPILGQIVIVYIWSVMLKKPTIYDVGSLFIENRQELKNKEKGATILAMVASLFNYLPILNTFAPIFAQILFLHHILK